ncbi:hypothetical protein [Vibrio rumoiensis]|uniref:hypothetical protein n=1 Tax=Vibrio rumoiensis TaxID=76258 RepID=UPI003AA81486
MKELIAALSDATVNRLKSPILGSFILSWAVINHVSILTFIFSTSQQKITLLQSSSDFWTTEPSLWLSPAMMNLLYPSITAIIYTFALPWLQHFIDIKRFRLIDAKRITAKHRNERFTYASQKRTSKVRAESNPEYWKEKLNRDLDNWDNKRQILENDLSQLRLERDSLQAQLTSSNTIQSNLSEEVEKLRKLHHDEKEKFSNQESELITELNRTNAEVESLLNKVDELDEANANLEELRRELAESEKAIAGLKEKLTLATQQYNDAQESIETLLVKFYDLSNFLSDKHQYQTIARAQGSSTGIQKVIPQIKIDEVLKPIKDIIEERAEPIKKAKLKQQLAEQHKMTQQELEKVKKSLASLEEPNKATQIWD